MMCKKCKNLMEKRQKYSLRQHYKCLECGWQTTRSELDTPKREAKQKLIECINMLVEKYHIDIAEASNLCDLINDIFPLTYEVSQ